MSDALPTAEQIALGLKWLRGTVGSCDPVRLKASADAIEAALATTREELAEARSDAADAEKQLEEFRECVSALRQQLSDARRENEAREKRLIRCLDRCRAFLEANKELVGVRASLIEQARALTERDTGGEEGVDV